MSTYERSTWGDLAPELLELILQRLTLMDYLKCREICSSWRKAVDNALATKGRCPPVSQLPFLFSLSRDSPPNLVSLLTPHRVFTMSTQTWPDEFERVQSVQGWLMFNRIHYVIEKDQTCCELSFFNSVSRATFKFPELFLFSGSRHYCYFNRIAFASAPPDSQEFLVVFLYVFSHQCQPKQRLAFCQVTHKSWTSIETIETRTNIFREIGVHNGKLYAFTIDHGIGIAIVFSLGDHANASTAERLVMLDPIPIRRRGSFGQLENYVFRYANEETYELAVDTTRGELLLVFHVKDRIIKGSSISIWTKGFRVFKLDFSGPRWCEVKHLGDRFLFVDWTGVRVVSAKGLDNAHEFNGGNCIFFCTANTLFVDPFPKHDLGVFYMDDESIKHFSVSSSLPVSVRDMWFSPNP